MRGWGERLRPPPAHVPFSHSSLSPKLSQTAANRRERNSKAHGDPAWASTICGTWSKGCEDLGPGLCPHPCGSTPASTGARGSLVGTLGTHSLALSTPLQTPRTSSEIHPQRGEALGMGWDLMGKGRGRSGHVQCALAGACVLGVGGIHLAWGAPQRQEVVVGL